MTSLAIFGLVCIGIGALSATVGLWTAGMFRIARQADENTDYDTLPDDWLFEPRQRPYDQETDEAA